MKTQHGTRVSFRTTSELVQVLEKTAKALGSSGRKGGKKYNISFALNHILEHWEKNGLPKLKRAS